MGSYLLRGLYRIWYRTFDVFPILKYGLVSFDNDTIMSYGNYFGNLITIIP